MTLSTIPRRLRAAIAGTAVAAALAACGGGTSQFEPFEAQRFFAFGDETSALTPTGRKYAINGFSSVTENGQTVQREDCTVNPIWVQSLASIYGFVFAECNPSAVADVRARTLAAPGARVADIAAQIDAAGGFRDKDLASVLAGANDVLDLYAQYPQRSEADLLADARARGTQLAQQVNRLVGLGVKVIVSTVPDMGLTPFAAQQRGAFTDIDRAALLTRLTTAFNEQLGVGVILDGRFIGLVQGDLRTQAMVRSPVSFGLTNVGSAACLETATLPGCTTTTLVDSASATTWMWADATRLSPAGHNQLATLAIDRARRNPF